MQVAANEIGLDQSRPLTVTGGLTFNGGPLNDYVMHSIATMAEVLRGAPGDKGLITANGGMLTKHAFGVYSTEPPAQPFQHQDVQAEVDAFPTRELAADHVGSATIEGYVVMYGADGFDSAYAGLLTDDGRRTWANTRDADLLVEMTQQEFVGRAATVNANNEFKVA